MQPGCCFLVRGKEIDAAVLSRNSPIPIIVTIDPAALPKLGNADFAHSLIGQLIRGAKRPLRSLGACNSEDDRYLRK